MAPAKKAAPTLKEVLEEKEAPKEEEFDRDEDYVDEEKDSFLSENVVATVPNKTPAELAAETPDETAARYNINTEITKEDAENPRVQVYPETVVKQVPSGTHLHPDIAKDLSNRGIAEMHTDNALVRHPDTAPTYDFAPDAETNDKFQKPVEEDEEEVVTEKL
ncbi:MAG: hypothetical protein HMLIMOIP_002100 [Candidatus Nitrosomirales archaeon]|jgi:hypothetical protein